MKVLLLAVSLLGMPNSAFSAVWIRIGGITWHQKPSYNSDNVGIGLEYDKNRQIYAIGKYLNSYRTTSDYLMTGYRVWKSGPFSAGGILGFVSGYPRFNGRLAPMAAPFVSIEGYGMGADLVALPPAVKKDGWALSLQGRISL